MIEWTYDRDARTLYAYFASIDEGEDATQIELDGYFLLDHAGQILGVHVDLGTHEPRLLHFALEHGEAHYEQRGPHLRVAFSDASPAGHADFVYPAIFDLDRAGHALGAEFIADPDFDLGSRLQHAQPYIVEVFGDDEDDGDGVPAVDDAETDQAPEPAWIEVGTPPLPVEEIRSGFVALVGSGGVPTSIHAGSGA